VASSRARSCLTRSMASRSTRTSERSTPMSRTSGARSSPIRARPDTCSPCTGSATSWPMPETEQGGRRYRRGQWRGGPPWAATGERPQWWPAGETWPPTDWQGPPWRRMRGRFLARVAIFATLLVFIAVGGATLVFLLLASALGAALPAPNGALLAALAILVALLLGASIRRAAAPIGDLIEAAGKVEAGDYGARVPERGAREIRGLARAFNQMAERLEQGA